MYGPSLSSIGGEQALTPPKRHSLGRPLPYQLADTEQAAPKAINLYPAKTFVRGDYRELPPLSRSYARLQGAYLLITTSSAGALAGPLTCMPYPRRQRSS